MSRPCFSGVLAKRANAMSKGTCHVVCPQDRHVSDLPLEVGRGGQSGFVYPCMTCGGASVGGATLAIVHVMAYFGAGCSA